RMAAREVAVKRYVVRLSAEERERLEALRTKGKIPARRLTKALILLKADVSDAVLSRKVRERPPVARIFDGEKEAKLIALACSQPPEGFARWSLRLLEEKVVELNIVDRASDSTIGRVLKKTLSSPTAKSAGSSRLRRIAPS